MADPSYLEGTIAWWPSRNQSNSKRSIRIKEEIPWGMGQNSERKVQPTSNLMLGEMVMTLNQIYLYQEEGSDTMNRGRKSQVSPSWGEGRTQYDNYRINSTALRKVANICDCRVSDASNRSRFICRSTQQGHFGPGSSWILLFCPSLI